jgi:hypothetical protein
VVPFGISPGELDMGKTHFEQIYTRALTALNNAIAVFNHANEPAQELRKLQDDVEKFQQNVTEREADFNNRLIEIFGYPYEADKGPLGAFDSNYDGPDTVHFNYVDYGELEGVPPPTTRTVTNTLRFLDVDALGVLTETSRQVVFHLATDGLTLVRPTAWAGPGMGRRAPGEIQRALSELIQARVRLEKGLRDYDNLMAQIEDQAALLEAQFGINAQEILIINQGNRKQESLNQSIRRSRTVQVGLRTAGQFAVLLANALAA